MSLLVEPNQAMTPTEIVVGRTAAPREGTVALGVLVAVEQLEDLEQSSPEEPRAGPHRPVSTSLLKKVQHWAGAARKVAFLGTS
jgi:hypothetical protein